MEQQQKRGNRNAKKNNYVDISGDKQAKYHTKKPVHGYENETLRGKLHHPW